MKLHYGDMTDSMCLMKIITEAKPTEIYNLAAQSHVKVSVWPRKKIYKNKLPVKIWGFPVNAATFLPSSVTSHLIIFLIRKESPLPSCREEARDRK